jgi:hypothetical protein
MKKITPKKTVEKSNLFIRGISKELKVKFQKKAKTLGYKPREYFDLIVKGL